MTDNFKKTILVDLDGVLNTYTGKYDKDFIPPIKEGALDFIKLLSKDFKLVIFTSRNLLLTSKWLIKNGLENYVENVTNVKEPSYLIIDDRCINYDGNYEELIKKISNFQVWYKKF
jgi:histidinol phosphatase-like enzyme